MKATKTVNTFTDSDSPVDNYFKNRNRTIETPKPAANYVSADMELVMKRKRSVILTIATNTGIKEANDWKKFNQFMKSSSILKKELHAYSYTELDDLSKQFRKLEANYNNSKEKVGNKAWHHATGIPKTSSN